VPKPGIELPRAEPRLCTAVAILLDASTSMIHSVRGTDGVERPKHEIAREALERIIDQTTAHVKKHPDLSLQLGILRFSSSIEEILPMAPFEPEPARAALRQVRASSGTAIGRALAGGFKALRATGCVRQHWICITDGENTSGPSPDCIARDLHRETQGAVGIHFVAFDTSARRFGFLGDVGEGPSRPPMARSWSYASRRSTRSASWPRRCRGNDLKPVGPCLEE